MAHVKEQNWFAVGLDVLVVIVGIFLGMQVNAWNKQRVDKTVSTQTEQALEIELRALTADIERIIAFNEKILDHTNEYLAGNYRLDDDSVGDVLLFTNYGLLNIGTPVLEREISSDRLIIGKEQLNTQLREIHHNLSRLEDARRYMDEMWNTMVVPYLMKRDAMTEFRLFASKKAFNKMIVEDMFADNEYRQLVAMNNSFLRSVVSELRKLGENVESAISSL